MTRSPFAAAGIIKQLYSRSASAFGITFVILFLLIAIFGWAIAPYGANEQMPGVAQQPPSLAHWFGVDHLGRDVFSRVILGAWDILTLAGMGTILAVTLGTALGLFTGYRGRFFDELTMRFFDSLLAIPALLMALLLLGSVGPSRQSILIVIIVVYTPIVARVVRSVVLGIKHQAFVEAARLQGESQTQILFQEIMPSLLPVLAVEGALRFSYAIFLVASLGYLGLGAQPPSPDWGLMVKEGRIHVAQAPWALYFPAGAIALIVVGVNLAADGLRRTLLHQD